MKNTNKLSKRKLLLCDNDDDMRTVVDKNDTDEENHISERGSYL